MKNKIMLTLSLSLLMIGFNTNTLANDTTSASTEAPATATESEKASEPSEKAATTEAIKAVVKEQATEKTTEKAAEPAKAVEPANKAVEEKVAEKTTEPAKTSPAKQDVFDFSGVSSLRGGNGIKDEALVARSKQLPADRAPIERNYFQQPPLVPHRVREYKITLNHNKCLACHSWKNYQKARATKISQTHFSDREGNAQSTVAARRYFCNQCHVPQVDAKPLVENEFKPVDDLK